MNKYMISKNQKESKTSFSFAKQYLKKNESPHRRVIKNPTLIVKYLNIFSQNDNLSRFRMS